MTCQISSTRSSHDVDEPSSVTENVQSNVFSVSVAHQRWAYRLHGGRSCPTVKLLTARLEMGKNPKLGFVFGSSCVNVEFGFGSGFGFFVEGIGKMFLWWSCLRINL